MKIRKGFVSNSSSSSFLINYPRRELRLSEIEDYFGGYNDEIPNHVRDITSYALWKNQFDYDYIIKTEDEEKYGCAMQIQSIPYLSDKCPRHYWEPKDPEDNDYSCKGCEYWKPQTIEEALDYRIERAAYYEWDEEKESLESFKKDVEENGSRIKELYIDERDPIDSGISFRDAYKIHNYVGNLFKKHNKITEESV